MHKTIVWVTLVLAIVVLALIALGHPGPGDQKSTVRLLPFKEYPGAVRCIVRRCPAYMASWFLSGHDCSIPFSCDQSLIATDASWATFFSEGGGGGSFIQEYPGIWSGLSRSSH